ncbi:hypothetical protein TREES_T100003812 [Tupaia chinensis]|uniref:Uncharacterized protein n=1 Tax=Tupaia chinensis TaxID=246437 RepID=L9L6Q6_TUPCH|nr:hypothetical protein TREES_T100003812 [Tupaia chinensis]
MFNYIGNFSRKESVMLKQTQNKEEEANALGLQQGGGYLLSLQAPVSVQLQQKGASGGRQFAPIERFNTESGAAYVSEVPFKGSGWQRPDPSRLQAPRRAQASESAREMPAQRQDPCPPRELELVDRASRAGGGNKTADPNCRDPNLRTNFLAQVGPDPSSPSLGRTVLSSGISSRVQLLNPIPKRLWLAAARPLPASGSSQSSGFRKRPRDASPEAGPVPTSRAGTGGSVLPDERGHRSHF